MRQEAIYFPFINVPNSTWFSRVLLYWETVSSIIPYEFVKEPEKLTKHTRDLIRVRLVREIIPSVHLPQISDRGEAFLEYVEQLGGALASRRQNFARRRTEKIHLEKFHWEVPKVLQRLGLASEPELQWVQVEEKTANDYMAYLAGAIGQAADSPLAPITDSKTGLSPFASDEDVEDATLDSVRFELLEEAFPSPRGRVSAADIDSFKQRHGDKLGQFRNWVETELTNIAAMPNESLRSRRLALTKEQIRIETAQIRSTMNEYGWLDIVCGPFCAILGVFNHFPKLVNVIFKSTRKQPHTAHSPLAYAAYAQKKLNLARRDTHGR